MPVAGCSDGPIEQEGKVHHGARALAGGLAVLMALGYAGGVGAAEDGVPFLDPLTNEPLEIELPPDATGAVEQFHAAGENSYHGDEQAIAEGEQIYGRWCQACHLPDGSGRIGPNLDDDQWKYARTGTVVGQFEIIYAGGAGAMQAFGTRLDQDEILKVIAFVETLRKQHQAEQLPRTQPSPVARTAASSVRLVPARAGS